MVALLEPKKKTSGHMSDGRPLTGSKRYRDSSNGDGSQSVPETPSMDEVLEKLASELYSDFDSRIKVLTADEHDNWYMELDASVKRQMMIEFEICE